MCSATAATQADICEIRVLVGVFSNSVMVRLMFSFLSPIKQNADQSGDAYKMRPSYALSCVLLITVVLS